jgi:hypothetical protein
MQQNIVHNGRARLRDNGRRVLLLDIPDMRPRANIRPQRDIVYFLYAYLPEPSQQTPPIFTVGAVGRRGKEGDRHPLLQIAQKTFGIVEITPTSVPAGVDTRAARNTSVKINLYLDLTAVAVNNVRALNGTNPDTSVATDALGNIIGYQLAHSPPASPFMKLFYNVSG